MGSIVAILPDREWQISFVHDDNLGDLSSFKPTVIIEEYNLSHIPVDIISFFKVFLRTDNAQGKSFKGTRTIIFHISKLDVDPGYKNIEKVRGGFNGA